MAYFFDHLEANLLSLPSSFRLSNFALFFLIVNILLAHPKLAFSAFRPLLFPRRRTILRQSRYSLSRRRRRGDIPRPTHRTKHPSPQLLQKLQQVSTPQQTPQHPRNPHRERKQSGTYLLSLISLFKLNHHTFPVIPVKTLTNGLPRINDQPFPYRSLLLSPNNTRHKNTAWS